jgi:hypothetical protein
MYFGMSFLEKELMLGHVQIYPAFSRSVLVPNYLCFGHDQNYGTFSQAMSMMGLY